MSTPTPGSEPSYPQEGTPTGQPGWTAPPPAQGYGVQNPQGYGVQNPQGYGVQNPQGYGAAPQGYGAAPQYPQGYGAPAAQRPGMVTAAGIIGIVWGGLGALFSLLLMFAAFGLGATLAGLILLLSLAFSVALLVGGIQAIQGKSPKLLLYASYAGIVLGLLQLVISLAATGGNAFSGILGLVIAGAIVFLLMQPQSKQYYSSRGITY